MTLSDPYRATRRAIEPYGRSRRRRCRRPARRNRCARSTRHATASTAHRTEATEPVTAVVSTRYHERAVALRAGVAGGQGGVGQPPPQALGATQGVGGDHEPPGTAPRKDPRGVGEQKVSADRGLERHEEGGEGHQGAWHHAVAVQAEGADHVPGQDDREQQDEAGQPGPLHPQRHAPDDEPARREEELPHRRRRRCPVLDGEDHREVEREQGDGSDGHPRPPPGRSPAAPTLPDHPKSSASRPTVSSSFCTNPSTGTVASRGPSPPPS